MRYHGVDTTKYQRVHEWDTAAARLYDLEADPQEKDDLAEKHPEIAERLKKEIQAWYSTNGRYPEFARE